MQNDNQVNKKEIPLNRGNIYIAGPINGVKNYKEKFNRAAAELRREGWECVVSPSDVIGDNLRDILAIEMEWLIRCADAVYMLRGWKESRGANAEWYVAQCLGLKIYYQEEQEPSFIPNLTT